MSLRATQTEQDRLERVLALWTLKEAYVKATGNGLHFDLKQIRLRFASDPLTAQGARLHTAHALLNGEAAKGWRFLLQKLRLDNPSEEGAAYWLAVAVQGRDGEGEISVGENEKQPLKISWLTLEAILRNARRIT